MHKLKINLEAIEHESDLNRESEEGLCDNGVRVGSLLISSEGVSTLGGPEFVLSLQDLQFFPEAEGGFLGKGSSGSVRRALHLQTNKVIALKEIKYTSIEHLTEIRRELETLYVSGMAPCPHLVDFYGACSFDGSVFIAMECMDGSLDSIRKPVPYRVLSEITRQILRGLVYLHRTRHLIHRDLKPSNVLYNRRTGEIKISDFGVSSYLECTKGGAQSFIGTVTYMSPERLKGDVYSYAADVWSLGLVVAELALGKFPFDDLRGDSIETRFWALVQHFGKDEPVLMLPRELPRELIDFINVCVKKNPDERPSCSQLLRHPFLTNAEDESYWHLPHEENIMLDMHHNEITSSIIQQTEHTESDFISRKVKEISQNKSSSELEEQECQEEQEKQEEEEEEERHQEHEEEKEEVEEKINLSLKDSIVEEQQQEKNFLMLSSNDNNNNGSKCNSVYSNKQLLQHWLNMPTLSSVQSLERKWEHNKTENDVNVKASLEVVKDSDNSSSICIKNDCNEKSNTLQSTCCTNNDNNKQSNCLAEITKESVNFNKGFLPNQANAAENSIDKTSNNTDDNIDHLLIKTATMQMKEESASLLPTSQVFCFSNASTSMKPTLMDCSVALENNTSSSSSSSPPLLQLQKELPEPNSHMQDADYFALHCQINEAEKCLGHTNISNLAGSSEDGHRLRRHHHYEHKHRHTQQNRNYHHHHHPHQTAHTHHRNNRNYETNIEVTNGYNNFYNNCNGNENSNIYHNSDVLLANQSQPQSPQSHVLENEPQEMLNLDEELNKLLL